MKKFTEVFPTQKLKQIAKMTLVGAPLLLTWCQWGVTETKTTNTKNEALWQTIEKKALDPFTENIAFVHDWIKKLMTFWAESLWIELLNRSGFKWSYFSYAWFVDTETSFQELQWDINIP